MKLWKPWAAILTAVVLVASGCKNEHASADLLEAAKNGSVEDIRVAIKDGANLDTATIEGKAPLTLAISSSNAEAVEVLVKAGANVNARDNYGQTPLQAAAEGSEKTEIIEALISAGADINVRGSNGETPCTLQQQKPVTSNLQKTTNAVTHPIAPST